MGIQAHEDDVNLIQDGGHSGAELIGEANGATSGYCLGIGLYPLETYDVPGIHDDQEGFYVLEGTGQAKVGDEEFDIRPGSAFIAQKGVPHSIKKDPGSVPVKVLWSHGAV